MENRRYDVEHSQSGYSPSESTSKGLGISTEAMGVLRNTYMLLGMTLAFSAVVAYMSMNAPAPGLLITIVGYIGLLFLTYKLKNSVWGIASVFALTGFMGYTLGPIIGMYVNAGASQIVANALTLTAVAFIGLSAVALVTRKDFSFMASFLTAGAFVLIGAMVLNIFMESSMFQLAIAAGFTIFASLMILFETSQIINGGERNYIIATVGLYVAIYNLFLSLLQLLTAFSGND